MLVGALALCGFLGAAVWAALVAGEAQPSPPSFGAFSGAAEFPSAMVATAEGGLIYGERLGGRIWRVARDGSTVELVAEVDVLATDDDERGLLGLAVDGEGRVFAAWTRATDGRLVVGEVAPADERLVWVGPVSAERANGGRLLWHGSSDRLVIGIGNLLDPALAEDDSAVNGKLLALDPAGPPEQRPTLLSGGWSNPFAMTADGDEIWVADNAEGTGFERIGRGDGGGVAPTEVRPHGGPIAPSGLVALGGGRFGLCGYAQRVLQEVVFEDGHARLTGEVLAPVCSIGVVALTDGRLVVATETWLAPVDP